MATVNTIKTRILNKYDLLANYTNFTPLKGEVCVAVIGEEATSNKGLKGDITKTPIVGIKVGDGEHSFNDLPWIQAIAGDVSTFVKGIVDEAKFNELVNALIANAKLATADELAALAAKVTEAEGDIDDLEAIVVTGDNSNEKLRAAINAVLGTAADTSDKATVYGAKKYAEEKAAAAQSAAEATAAGKYEEKGVAQGLLNTLVSEGAVHANTEAITAINGKIGNVAYTGASLTAAIKDIQDAIGGSGENSIGSTVADLSERVESLEETVGDSTEGLVKDVADLQAAIAEGGALGSKVATLESEMDVVQAATAGYDGTNTIATAIHGVSEVANAANTKAGENETKVNTLIGSDTGKSVRDIAGLVISESLVGGGEKFDTLQEIAAWIKDHPADAAAMNEAIQSVKENLGYTTDEEGKEVVPSTVDARIAAAIAELEIGNYATVEALNSVASRVKTIEEAPYATEAYADGKASAAQAAAEATAAADATAKANAAQAAAEATASADATAKANKALEDATTLVNALAGEGNTATVKANAEAITGLNNRINDLDYTDSEDGVVATVSQTDGKISVTHKKVGVADLADEVFVFYCGNATGYAEDMKTVNI